MNSLSYAQKMFALVPKYSVARNIRQISSVHLPSQTIEVPAPFNRLTTQEASADRLLFSWFDGAWNKTRNMVLDNWESAGLIKKRKPNDENRKAMGGSFPAKMGNESPDRVDNVSSSADELAKAKNKAQRHLAENWDIIRQANARTTQSIVDNAKEGVTTTIEELSKSAKEKAGSLIDDTKEEIKSKIKEKADDVKAKISK